MRAGCFKRNTAPCEVGPAGRIFNVVYGAKVTVSDPTPPASSSVEAAGLLAGGPRDGSDPVTVSAADNAGIERVEIIDVTDPNAPRVVGSENYDVGFTYEAGEQRTDAGGTCSARLAKPCPDLSRETVRPSSLQVGRRNLLVRVVDPGGNVPRPRAVPGRRRDPVRPRRRQRHAAPRSRPASSSASRRPRSRARPSATAARSASAGG